MARKVKVWRLHMPNARHFWTGWSILLASVVARAAGQADGPPCHWDWVSNRFYRISGAATSRIESLSSDWTLCWSNATLGGTVAVEITSALCDGWVRYEHLATVVTDPVSTAAVTDPTSVRGSGQTNSFAPGDDGALQPGELWPSPRFVLQTDTDLVLDRLTGLMWTRGADLFTSAAWTGAIDLCENLDYGGHSDWHLPTVAQINTLTGYGSDQPVDPLFTNVAGTYYSSTWHGSGYFWSLELPGGYIQVTSAGGLRVWPVRDPGVDAPSPVPRTGAPTTAFPGDDRSRRAGRPWPTPRFRVPATTNVVTDNLTGLMWARSASRCPETNWLAALEFCDELELDGFTDWRLPSVCELSSLWVFGGGSPALPAGHPFVGVSKYTLYWTSTTLTANTNYAWRIYAMYPTHQQGPKSDVSGVWPVRGGKVSPP